MQLSGSRWPGSTAARTASELPGSHSCSTLFDDGEKRRKPSESPAEPSHNRPGSKDRVERALRLSPGSLRPGSGIKVKVEARA